MRLKIIDMEKLTFLPVLTAFAVFSIVGCSGTLSKANVTDKSQLVAYSAALLDHWEEWAGKPSDELWDAMARIREQRVARGVSVDVDGRRLAVAQPRSKDDYIILVSILGHDDYSAIHKGGGFTYYKEGASKYEWIGVADGNAIDLDR